MLALGIWVRMYSEPTTETSLASFTWVARPPVDGAPREPVTISSCTWLAVDCANAPPARSKPVAMAVVAHRARFSFKCMQLPSLIGPSRQPKTAQCLDGVGMAPD